MDDCKVCGKPFKRHYRRGGERQIYCSRACRYVANYVEKVCPTCGKAFRTNRLSVRKDYCSLECIQRRSCELCGKTITGRNRMNSGLRRFCSRKCSAMFTRTLGSANGYRLLGFAYAIARSGRLACEECSTDDIAVLHVHHLRGRSNQPSNLITLCANCHDRRHRTGSVSRQRDAERATTLAAMPGLKSRLS